MLAFYRLSQGEGSGAIGKAVHVDILAMHQEAEGFRLLIKSDKINVRKSLIFYYNLLIDVILG